MVPSPRLILLVMASAPLFLAGTLYEGAAAVGVLYGIALALYTGLDALLLPRRRHITVKRSIVERIWVGDPTVLRFAVENRTRRRIQVQLAEDSPEEIDVFPRACQASLRPGQTAELECRLTAHQRGTHRLARNLARVLPATGRLAP